jgi:hypothetical protein
MKKERKIRGFPTLFLSPLNATAQNKLTKTGAKRKIVLIISAQIHFVKIQINPFTLTKGRQHSK